MKKIMIGTGNPAKLEEYKRFLAEFGLEVVSSGEMNIPEPQEDAKTFEEEAVKKARYYFEKSGIPTIVDDGGFEIEALNGEPGTRSKRWLGHEMSDEEIVAEVMKRMQGQANRNAQHTVVIAVASPLGIYTSSGHIKGQVAEKPSDKVIAKFPYRSVLYLPGYGKYWCELSEDEEKILSHRLHALDKLKDILKEISKP